MNQTDKDNSGKGASRRSILLCAAAAVAGSLALAATAGWELLRYLIGPRLTDAQRAALIADEQASLAAQMRLNQLKAERLSKSRIAVARLDDLSETRGIMCTDYFLQPAIIYKTEEERPIARSAVCTHLGCTVQPDFVDGKILCACHLSYFDVGSGRPLAGPAQYPLAQEPIVVEGDTVYLLRPTSPITIGPSQTPMRAL